VLGSAVNPVLREGNSDRRAALSVKKFAQKNPHRMMKDWPKDGSKTRIAHMTEKDFYGSEKSCTLAAPTSVNIEFTPNGGAKKVLKEGLGLLAGEVIDASVMNVAALRAFYAKTIDECRRDGTLLSLHLKATMMKISDPVMFGHAVSVFFGAALDKHAAALREVGANVNNGLAGVLEKLDKLPPAKKAEIEAAVKAVQAVYLRNVFPNMKLDWGYHPNNIGHEDFPGCFRCHNGNLAAKDGTAISSDCEACHQVLAMEEENPEILTQLGLK